MIRGRHTAITFATAMLCAMPALGRELDVGPTRAFSTPSQAAAVAENGDVVRIDPGSYADCATWRASRLLIEGTGAGVLIAGRTCAGKAIFITQGADTVVRRITFAEASVVEHNGAGIRAEGRNLTVDHSRFLNNENGILAGGPPDSILRITDSEFIGNGGCIGSCAHGVYAGAAIALLDIQRCVFLDTKIAHHIKSRARSTIIRDSRIEDGARGTSSYLIDVPNGGDVLIERNTMEKGPHSSNPGVAISIGSEGVKNSTQKLIIRNNVFRSDLPARTVFVRNDTSAPVALDGNKFTGNVQPLGQ